MELINYVVRSGDTLTKIATQHGSTVAELLELNSFIVNADHIEVGWNLSVTARTSPAPTSASSPAPAQADTPATEPAVLRLPPLQHAKEVLNTLFEKASHPCKPRFANIIYATQEQSFWLLPKEADDALSESAHILEQQVAPSKSKEERKKGLDACGLLDYFMEPNLSSFLEGQEKERMQFFEREHPDIEDLNLAIQLQDRALGIEPRPTEPTNDRAEASRRADEDIKRIPDGMARRHKLRVLQREWEKLRDIAVKKAKEQNYTYQDGALFTPEALEAKKRVDHYLKTRDEVLKYGELPTYEQDELAKLLEQQQQRYREIQEFTQHYGPSLKYQEVFTQLTALTAYKTYIDAIIKVADYGLAVPEFALIMASGGAGSGVQRFKQYQEHLARQQTVEDEMREKYAGWVKSTGQNMLPPAGLLAAEREAWDAEQMALQQLYAEAQQAVASSKPRRHLLWNPEQFKPRPVERLVKSDFPLHEVSWPDSPKPLGHTSMMVLNGLTKPNIKKSASFAGNSSAQPGSRSAFSDWLKGMGAFEIKDQGDWFDNNGWFEVERFYEYLTKLGWQVDSLKNAATRKQWGDRLCEVVFLDSVRRSIRLLDRTPQAQLVRFLSAPPERIQTSTEASGPTLRDATASFETTLDIDLARGEVELFNIELPKAKEAQPVLAKYVDYQEKVAILDLGRFSACFNARAWGFAGASLQLAANLDLSPSRLRYGSSLDPIEPASRTANTASTARTEDLGQATSAPVQLEDAASASFKLFAGVQAGIEVTGQLNWLPPKGLVSTRLPTGQTKNTEEKWLNLAHLTAEISAAIGLGVDSEVSLSLDKGRFILRLKASLIAGPGASGSFAFAVGYEAIGELMDVMRRELRKNMYHQLKWVDGSAFELLSKLNVFGAVGMDVGMIYTLSLTTADAVANLYEALTAGGKGGPVAHSIISYENQDELERWFVEALPEALGPMLMTLISPAEAFVIKASDAVDGTSRENVKTYSKTECWHLQQQAIERILGWIVRNAQNNGTLPNAQRQFEEACTRMNRFGSKPPKPGQAYCENRMNMDHFMAAKVMNIGQDANRNERMRARYLTHASALGQLKDGFCQETNHYGITYMPGGHATYNGPGE
ncbi:LysM peptidoglycan-binding domain-containing protein [Aquipseudomonas alcaligenes]|jgi:murein DD-endopeptidase MepM/ murein hydrolase activator NlpD|uniref:LysM peptidoglycan-binding domain-containing protein n=1 Tax=Aquipseudomonas alcaligenes TaxID=43263 RepID=UPI001F44D37F|nr:LysM domain-containing protein [Pseudomonas alcaligenes]